MFKLSSLLSFNIIHSFFLAALHNFCIVLLCTEMWTEHVFNISENMLWGGTEECDILFYVVGTIMWTITETKETEEERVSSVRSQVRVGRNSNRNILWWNFRKKILKNFYDLYFLWWELINARMSPACLMAFLQITSIICAQNCEINQCHMFGHNLFKHLILIFFL